MSERCGSARAPSCAPRFEGNSLKKIITVQVKIRRFQVGTSAPATMRVCLSVVLGAVSAGELFIVRSVTCVWVRPSQFGGGRGGTVTDAEVAREDEFLRPRLPLPPPHPHHPFTIKLWLLWRPESEGVGTGEVLYERSTADFRAHTHVTNLTFDATRPTALKGIRRLCDVVLSYDA